jgi:hypothetical protein
LSRFGVAEKTEKGNFFSLNFVTVKLVPGVFRGADQRGAIGFSNGGLALEIFTFYCSMYGRYPTTLYVVKKNTGMVGLG